MTVLSRTVLAAALALAAMPALAEGPYSQTVFFGDSLTDGGYFRPLLPQQIQANAGQFTTNPGWVWAQWLADFYGTGAAPGWTASPTGPAPAAGSNFAVGGARVGSDGSGAFGPIPSLVAQTNAYLAANGGRADPNALYTVWGGANDLFAVTAGAPAQATILSAVTAQVGIIGSLKAAGAQYVLVPTIPDLGLTPAFRAQGATVQGQGTALATAYNNALFASLANAGLQVIPLDTFRLLQEIVADPARYGFANVTGTACQPQIVAQSLTCGPSSYVSPDAPNTYAFADGVHPTSGAHRILADLALSALEGPRQIAVLPHAAAMSGRSRAERVGTHYDDRAQADGRRWWLDLRGDVVDYDDGDLYQGNGPSLIGGIDWTSGNTVLGLFAGYGQQGNDWGNNRGNWDQSEASIGLFAGWYGDSGGWINGQAGYTRLDFDIERAVPLGPAVRVHRSSPSGDGMTAALAGGWNLGEGALRHGPVLGLTAQRIEIRAHAESEPTLSTSLAYPRQRVNSLIGSAGWQASYAVSELFAPYARVAWEREFEPYAQQAFARSQSIPEASQYAVPGVAFDRDYGTVTLGVRTRLFGLDGNFGATATLGQDDGSRATVFATLGSRF